MKILAIDTTGQSACCCIVEDKKIISEFIVDYNMTHSQTIMPMIKNMVDMTEFDLKELDYIACSSGPGSFTGLRIGAATAKGLAHGLKIPIIPVPTLDCLAYNIFETDKIICPIMDARRHQVYTAFFKWEDRKFLRISDYMAQDINYVIEEVKKFNKNVIFLGDGVPVNEEILLKQNFILAPLNCNTQNCASVGALALDYAKDNKFVKYSEFVPMYLRKPQAERELEEKSGGK